ncbi:LamB/YcsF family protein [Oceanobacillus luteolus]|uniref:5-oxoprolinase subunit A n=1 Tax=Oceanobacillus luteolus TaxID=1274358 RepID=A0ABW4HWT2_9BACI
MKQHTVDLNSDLGESFGAYIIGQDELVMKHISSANIAAGYHAGDHNVLSRSVKMALENHVGIGAHPGFPDLQGFGRRNLFLNPEEIYNMVVYQIGAVKAFVKVHKTVLNHVKPHGALYNIAARDKETAQAIAQAVYDVNPELILFGLSGGELLKAGEKIGLKTAAEVFADRSYQPDGTLTSRTEPNALIHDPDEAVHRVITMVKDGKVEAVDGSNIPIQADTVCVHGDSEQALAFVTKLRQDLVKNGITIKRVGS